MKIKSHGMKQYNKKIRLLIPSNRGALYDVNEAM